MNVRCSTEFLEMVRAENQIAIYGTGYVAQRYWDALVLNGLNHKVQMFITTTSERNEFCGLPVVSVDNVNNRKVLVCIAVHEALLEEIVNELDVRKFAKYIWVYPFLNSLYFGEIKYHNVTIPISEFWKANRFNYHIAIRYAVIEQFFKKNIYGFEAYLRYMREVFSEETARNRLGLFIELIENIQKNGMKSDSQIILLDDYTIIDGAHRASIYIYREKKEFKCDMYAKNKDKYGEHNNSVILSDELAKRLFNEDIIMKLRNINQQIDNNYCVRNVDENAQLCPIDENDL